jgi:hypothetical protein
MNDRDDAPQLWVSPVVVVTRTFPARPASWAEARDFLHGALAQGDAPEATTPEVQTAIGEALLAAAGTRDPAFQVSVRLFPDGFEIEVLGGSAPRTAVAGTTDDVPVAPRSVAGWLSATLEAEGISQEQAARRLGVSVRTVGRWVRGETEPRLREMRRLTEVFGG